MTEIIWQQYYFVGTQSLRTSEAAWLNVTTALTEHQAFEGRIVHSSWELGGFHTYQLKQLRREQAVEQLGLNSLLITKTTERINT